MPTQILEQLDATQRLAAQATRGQVAILAVAGAGKTRTISHRIAYAVATGEQNPKLGLALSYTTRSAAELRLRIADLGVEDFATSTIHGAAWRQLRHFWPSVLGGEPWQVLSNRSRVFERAFELADLNLSAAQMRTWVIELERLKATGYSSESYLELVPDANRDLAIVWGHYNDLCMRARFVDFDDVIQLATGLLQSRPDVLSQIQQRYNWFTVDEYQDITPLQERLLQLWVGNRSELCVVGDPTQSIYEFAGAAPEFLNARVQDSKTKVFKLETSYRCPEEIAKITNPIAKWLGGLEIQSTKSDGDLSLVDFQDEADELKSVANSIRGLVDSGHKHSEIAVLLRTTQAVQEFTRFLENAGLPVISKPNFRFADSKLVKQALLVLKTFSPAETVSVRDSVQAAIQGLGWTEHWSSSGLSLTEWVGLNTLLEAVSKEHESISQLLDSLGSQLLAAAEPKAAAITVSTIHQAKGLEWDTVFLPRFVDPKEASEASLISHARVQYVGLTRARKRLQISYSKADGSRSRFLQADLPSAPLRPSAPQTFEIVAEAQELKPELCESCGQGLSQPLEILTRWCEKCQPPVQSTLFEKLVALRKQIAVDRQQPEWLILSDSALRAVAIRVPKSDSELLAIQSFRRLDAAELTQFLEILKLQN